MNYIVLYADDFPTDVWEQYCDICGADSDSAYLKIKFRIEDVEYEE